MRCTLGESGQETLRSQTLRKWKRWTHLDSTPESSMQTKCCKQVETSNSQSQMGNNQNEEKNNKFFKENQINYILQPHFKKTQCGMMKKLKSDSWTFTRNFIYRHHVEPRIKLYMPREETFPIPMKYIDVARTTYTSLDVLLEKILKITGTWMETENYLMHGQDSQESFYQKESSPEKYTWSGKRLTKKQTTSRPDDVWPDLWKIMSDAAKKNAKQRWSIEKPKTRQRQTIEWNILH